MLQIKLSPRVLFDYYAASSVEEAVSYLGAHQGEARVVSGGTELLPQVQRGELAAGHLVDVSQIAALRRVAVGADQVVIGGAAPLSRLAAHEKLNARCRLLPVAARSIGTPALQRLATAGGNVACGWGNSDVALALLALDAEAEISGYMGAQWVPIRSLYVGGGHSRVDATREVLSALRFRPLDRGQGSALVRLEASAGPGRADLVGVTIVELAPDASATAWPVVSWAAVALGVAREPPQRYPEIEQALLGAPWPVARGLLSDGVRDVLASLDVEHPANRRLDEAVALLATCWERACQRARGAQEADATGGA